MSDDANSVFVVVVVVWLLLCCVCVYVCVCARARASGRAGVPCLRVCVFHRQCPTFAEFCSVARFCAIHSQSYAVDGNKYCDVKLMFCYCSLVL